MQARHLLSIALIATGIGLFAVGCSRQWHRQKADREGECLINEKGGRLENGHIYANPNSRMFDPFAADCPPLPPDDPQSHQLMHCVDGKKGWKHWHRNGNAGTVEPTGWIAALPRDDKGTVQLDLRQAIGVARVNSRDYQANLETLYLSALDVSFERFRFDNQFFGGNRTFQDFRGRNVGRRSVLSVNNFATTQRLTATGGELVVGLANSLVWDFWGSDTDLLSSTIDFSLVQPLLRLGGRARVLEQLTQTERNLLANVRQMQQFRHGFYVNVATGRNSGSGPSAGGRVGQAGLGLIAGVPSGRSGAADAGGYMGLVQDQQQIRNQASNIAALRDSLAQLEAAFDANRITSRLQVDQARQALLNAQSSLLSARAAYDTRVDTFKLTLGLPPTLDVTIKDRLLDQFVLIDPALTAIQDELGTILSDIRRGRENPSDALSQRSVGALQKLDERIDKQLSLAMNDLQQLESRLPNRRQQLSNVKLKIDEMQADVDSRVYDEAVLMQRVEFLRKRLPSLGDELDTIRKNRSLIDSPVDDASLVADEGADIEAVEGEGEARKISPATAKWRRLSTNATKLSDLLLELSLLHAEARLQGIVLLPMEISPEEALEYARGNRLDWMNARANLVDVWRKIEFFANDLKSDLDLVIDGQLGTDPDNVVKIDADHSRVRFGLQFDTPTARLAERNRYRESLINYQDARRDYMLFEDRVAQSVRNTLRIVDLSQVNLEVRRAAVQVAIAQVDIARLKLNPPVRPNQASKSASPTAARDLVSALTDLLDAQNDFLNVWVSYEVLRVLLDFEMGTMQLDPMGVWIDPGEIRSSTGPPPAAAGELPVPLPALEIAPAPTPAVVPAEVLRLAPASPVVIPAGVPRSREAAQPANPVNSAKPIRLPRST